MENVDKFWKPSQQKSTAFQLRNRQSKDLAEAWLRKKRKEKPMNWLLMSTAHFWMRHVPRFSHRHRVFFNWIDI